MYVQSQIVIEYRSGRKLTWESSHEVDIIPEVQPAVCVGHDVNARLTVANVTPGTIIVKGIPPGQSVRASLTNTRLPI